MDDRPTAWACKKKRESRIADARIGATEGVAPITESPMKWAQVVADYTPAANIIWWKFCLAEILQAEKLLAFNDE
jgi:hypothetical protein